MALSREKKHSRDLKEELNDKEIIDVEQNVKKDDSKTEEKNDDKNELQEILDNVQAEKEALMSKLELLQNEHEKIQSVTGYTLSEELSFPSTIPKQYYVYQKYFSITSFYPKSGIQIPCRRRSNFVPLFSFNF